MPVGKKGRYNYGRKFTLGKREVMYRYVNKDKKTKTLVDARTKKVITRGTRTKFGPTYRKK